MKKLTKKAIVSRKAASAAAETPSTPRVRVAGSTILAVLIALVFIGIVTTAMLRNTGSQSGASVGYGTMQTMAITTKSGILATESYFNLSAAPGGHGDSAGTVGLITKFVNATGNAKNNMYVLFGKNEKGQEIAAGQYFRSRIQNVDHNSNKIVFEIESGKSKNGRAMKKALAFYDMDEDVVIKSMTKYNAHNAIYMKGGLKDGNNGMEVYGPVTFEDNVKFQNANSIFHGDAYFHKGVDFLRAVEFKDKAYFNDYLSLQNMDGSLISMFDSAVGINGNLSTGNKVNQTIKFNGDLWFNGDFKVPGGFSPDYQVKVAGNANSNFYYSNNISMKTSLSDNGKCQMCPLSGPCNPFFNGMVGGCCVHNCSHDVTLSQRISGFGNLAPTPSGWSANIDNIPTKMGIGTLDDRRDPQLDISKIPADKCTTLAINGEKTLSIADINDMYQAASSAGKLYDGEHLVIKATSGNLKFDPNGVLDKKVIFVLEDNAKINGQYFKTTENSSSLIYIGKGNAAINNSFDLNGPFYGLIYIDTLNTALNYISFGAGDVLEGAIHSFSNKNITWNTSNANSPPVIRFNESVLNRFASLLKYSDASADKVTEYTEKNTEKRVHLRGIGYYFY